MPNTSEKLFSTTGMLSDNGIRTYFKNGIDIHIDEKDAKYSEEINSESSKIYEDINNNVESKSITKAHFKKNIVALQKFLNKYKVPFLSSTITYLIITPFLTTFIINKTMDDIWTVFKNLPAPLFLALILLGVYIFSKRGEKR